MQISEDIGVFSLCERHADALPSWFEGLSLAACDPRLRNRLAQSHFPLSAGSREPRPPQPAQESLAINIASRAI
jgi:hypothetical protein